MQNPFRYFNNLPEVIRLTVMKYIRYPLSLRQGENLLFDRGIEFATKQSVSGGTSWVRCLRAMVGVAGGKRMSAYG